MQPIVDRRYIKKCVAVTIPGHASHNHDKQFTETIRCLYTGPHPGRRSGCHPADKPVINCRSTRLFVPITIGGHRIYFVLPAEESFRTVAYDALDRKRVRCLLGEPNGRCPRIAISSSLLCVGPACAGQASFIR